MNRTKALQHMIAWAIQQIYQSQKEAKEILDDKEMPDKEKILHLQGKNGCDYRLLNYMILLVPALDIAQEEFPDQKEFFEWFKERFEHAKTSNYITGSCECKGCKEKD